MLVVGHTTKQMKHGCSWNVQICCPLVEMSPLGLRPRDDMSTSGQHIWMFHLQPCIICITCFALCLMSYFWNKQSRSNGVIFLILDTESWKKTLDRCHTCDFVAHLWRASKWHRTERRSIPRTSRVRRAMMQRAICPVTLTTLTRDPLSRVKITRLCRRCDIGLIYQYPHWPNAPICWTRHSQRTPKFLH